MKKLNTLILLSLFCFSAFSCDNMPQRTNAVNNEVKSKVNADSVKGQKVKTTTAYPVSKEAQMWLSKVTEIADWYNTTFDNYQKFLSGKMCPIVNKKVRDDCSGLATACLLNYGIYTGNKIFNSADFRSKDGALGKILQKKFTPIEGNFKQTDYDKFQPGDILAGYMVENGKVTKAHGHVTIYAGNGKFYDWGGWAYKSKSQPVSGEESDGYMHDHMYTIIWRIKGQNK